MNRRMIDAAWLAVVAGALVVTGIGGGVAMFGSPSLGVSAELPPGTVRHVFPGGPAWRDGIRVGQRVATLDDTDDATWTLETTAGSMVFITNLPAHRLELAGGLPLAIVGTLLAALALVAARWRPPIAAAFAVIGATLGAEVVLLAGDPLLSTVVTVGALAIAAAALMITGHRRALVPFAALLAAIAVAWIVARFVAPGAFEAAETARRGALVATGGLLLLLALPLEPDRWRATARSVAGVDVLVAAGLVALAALLWRVVELPPALVAAVVAATALGYAVVRGIAARVIDRLVLAETRERSRIVAIEDERRRLARELHDEPLQRLAGVIKDLERDGTSPAETSELMAIADDLRGLATDLRPPALDDLGLVPALTGLAAAGPPLVRVDIDDRTGYEAAERLPPEVELALYRITAEAVRNAVSHSGGTVVVVSGEVTQDRVSLVVTDDGRGIDPALLRERQREGHLGLSTMRQRAALVGATLDVDSTPSGVHARLAWSRP